MHRSNGRSILGGLFIVFGLLLILDNFTFVNIHVFSWPVILIITGAAILSNSHRNYWGIFALFFGFLGLSAKIFGFSLGYFFSAFWPLGIIAIGLYLILNRHNPAGNSFGNNAKILSDIIDETTVFSDTKRKIYSKNFKGGKITTLFGSTSLDLRETELADGNQILDVVSIFGGITINAGNDFNIILNVSSIFGGFEDKRPKTHSDIPQSNSSITIKGLTLFGGGVIYN